MYPVGKK